MRARKQKGCLSRVRRKGGAEVWIFRWREQLPDGSRKPRKQVVGSVRQLRTETAAWRKVKALGLEPNGTSRPRTYGQLIEHYRSTELAADNTEKAYSTKEIYAEFIDNWIQPRWGRVPLTAFSGPVAVQVESWLRSLERARGTKAKIRNIMSAVCTHAQRWGWLERNPISQVRQSARRERVPEALTVEELQALFAHMEQLDRVLVLLDVPTGMRVGELHALQWRDIDLCERKLRIHKSIWRQVVGPVKTEESEQEMPLDEAMVRDLVAWRRETPYAGDEDWVFASPKMRGKQPYWPSARMRHIRRAALQAGISKRISWHVFRHTFSTLLAQNEEDVKTVQSLMRHASSRVTLDIYTHGVSAKKRAAQARVVEMVWPAAGERRALQ
jgi:integrase